ncbi:endonuclease/exonuclease/phosphatase family protein [Cupriavidus plantarum]|uniref:Endonuclease/exonuclease/phosphatase family metal-dependent hydrolase n=1 Tax=Cupriavidus plantarum TaxID=942865 RepID=A0A316FH13_9BURK|nr:endonuclease/exonuclease/phosphatase family protein [Cupriavidus plantarum]PWK36940.1 endonuclease/exonuclease/phosphatase family metal-dependent hydrolase [Cupriavidus plantarum]
MELLNWNVQWGRGADGRVDLARTVATLREMADADVICLQEITRGFTDMAGGPQPDQVAELAALLPGYRILFAPGVDRFGNDGAPRQFGNVIATRLPVREVFRHALPWPADPGVPSMPRVALEVTVEAGLPNAPYPVRVITTHLEYYSALQRAAQAEALRGWHAEACAHARQPGRNEKGPGPFMPEPRPTRAILCGDFNSKVDDVAYRRMLEPYADDNDANGTTNWVDAWVHAHPGQPHAPTCALYDREQWNEPPFACDFVFVTEDLRDAVRRCEVNGDTPNSDHQPIHLSMDTQR